MTERGNISRRQFVASAISAATVSSLPAHSVFAEVASVRTAARQTSPATLTDARGWMDQGIENLAKSPHAKQIFVAEEGVVVDGDFGVERVDFAVFGQDERIDFG